MMDFEFTFEMDFTGNVAEVKKVALRRARLIEDGLTVDDIDVSVRMTKTIHGPVSPHSPALIEVTVSFWVGP